MDFQVCGQRYMAGREHREGTHVAVKLQSQKKKGGKERKKEGRTVLICCVFSPDPSLYVTQQHQCLTHSTRLAPKCMLLEHSETNGWLALNDGLLNRASESPWV